MNTDDNHVAIVGVGCRFPGSDDVDEFWETLLNGENHITEIPNDRWNIDAFFTPEGGVGKYYCNKAGLISSGSAWDNKFFGINNIEAASVDPQHRLALECVHMALEDAGITNEQISGTRTGVFIGLMNHGFEVINSERFDKITNNTVTGYATTICSNRISYIYNLTGPSVTLDTACSASIVALHTACQAMKNGDCDMAIVGGVNRILAPQNLVGLAQAGMMSRTGQCHAFSSKADGYTRSEGCGVVLLKPLKKAKKDNNNIWGSVIGSAVNHDGHSATPITKPSSQQQKSLMQKLLKECNVNPNDVGYIEAHGTGTQVGDAAESIAIIEAYGTSRDPQSGPCHVGSSKTNIGHTESASGMAGLIKVLLMMKHAQMVPSLHYKDNPNKSIKFAENNLCVTTEVNEWSVNKHGKRVAALNSFGFGGTNTHVLLEGDCNQRISESSGQLTDPLIIALSAANTECLKSTVEYYLSKVKVEKYSLKDLSYTSTVKRNHYPYRAAFPFTSFGELKSSLETHLNGEPPQSLGPSDVQIYFVFCGMGTTWEGMSRELTKRYSSFYSKIKAVSDIFKRLSGASLIDSISRITPSSPPSIVQPALFAYQVAMCELFKDMGVTPHCVVGHSVGEVAAAHVVGGLNLEDAVRVIYHRGRLQDTVAGGKMLVVGKLDVDRVEEMCKPFNGRLCIAAYNSQTSCTISGDAQAVEEMLQKLTNLNKDMSMNLFLRVLPVPSAFHSHHIDPIVSALEAEIGDLQSSAATTKSSMFSTVSGNEIGLDKLCTAQYWGENMRKPVLFHAALRNALSRDKTNIIIEIGPKPALRANIAEVCAFPMTFKHMPSAKANSEIPTIMSTFCELYQSGLPIRWEELFENNVLHNTTIPRYQFQRRLQPVETEVNESLEGLKSVAHPFIRIISNFPPKFQVILDSSELSFVRDHVVFNDMIAPGTIQAEIALHCATTIHGPPVTLRNCEVDVDLLSPLNTNVKTKLTVAVTTGTPNVYDLTVSRDKTVVSKCSARIGIRPKKTKPLNIGLIRWRLTGHISSENFYEIIESAGFQYGPSLKGIQECWFSNNEVLSSIKVPDEVLSEVPVFCVHPAVLDMLLQASMLFVRTVNVSSDSDNNTLPRYLPQMFSGLVVHSAVEDHVYGYLHLIDKTDSHIEFGAVLLDGTSRVIAECSKFILKNTVSVLPERIFYGVTWEKQDGSVIPRGSTQSGKTVVFAKDCSLSKALCNSLGPDVTVVHVNSNTGTLFSQTGILQPGTKAEMAAFLRKFTNLVFCWACSTPECSLQVNEADNSAKFSCNGLRHICAIIQAFGLKLPVIVVTFNTQFCGDELSVNINVIGSEMWGMVRCLHNEVNTYETPILLIDMSACSKHELEHLFNIVQNPRELESPEIALRGPDIFFNSIHRVDREVNQHRFRQNHVTDYHSRPLRMQITGDGQNKSPQYVLTKEMMENDDRNVVVLVSSFCQPDSLMLPPTVNAEGDEPFDIHADQFLTVVDIVGFIVDKKNSRLKDRQEVVVCYPTIVQSVLEVPESCVIPIKSVPKPCRQLLSTFVMFWDILNCKVRLSAMDNVLVLYGDKQRQLSVLLNRVIQYYSKNVTSSVIEKDLTIDGYDKIFLLTDVSDAPSMSKDMMQRTTVVQELFPRSGINNHWLNPNYLTLALARTLKWLKKLDKKGLLPGPSVIGTGYQNNFQRQLSPKSRSGIYYRAKLEEQCPVLCDRRTLFDRAAMYLVIGGHTGLGKEVVRFLAARNAGFIVILSRREAAEKELSFVKETSDLFCSKISCVQADIADYKHLSSVMNKLRMSHPTYPIKGVFSGAMVLSDGIVENQSYEDFCKVLNPKVIGTLNLHLVTQNDPIDYFVMHSSIASAIGNHGQTNYGAANSFMDSFAFYRRKLGTPGQTINWGPLALGALEGRGNVARSFALKGMEPLTVSEIHHCLESILVANLPQVIAWKVNWRKIVRNGVITRVKSSPRYRCRSFIDSAQQKIKDEEIDAPESARREFGEEDKKLPPVQRYKKLVEFLQYSISEILVIKVSSVLEEESLSNLGIDSNFAVEVRLLVSQHTSYNLPVASLLSDSATISSIAHEVNEFLSSPKKSFRQVKGLK